MNSFASHKLAELETLNGSLLTPLQRQVIQNNIADVAEQIINLTYNPNNPVQFAQDDAHLKGQLAAFRFLLIRAEESELQLRILARNSQSDNNS